MIKLRPAVVAGVVVDCCETTLDDFRNHIVEDEPNMTDRLFGSVSNALDGRAIGNLKWKARTLRTARGKAAEEKRHGADVLGVLEIDLSDYKVKKGFLLQAKIAEPGKPLSSGEWQRFQGQCQTMRRRTCEAFAVIYSRQKGVLFIPADTIMEIGRDQLFEVGSRSLFGFFKGHVKCEIGDRKLDAPTIEVLDRLIKSESISPDEFGAETVLAMKVTEAS